MHIDLFADDTKIYFYYASRVKYFFYKIIYFINLFSQWANKWQLNISLSNV